MRRIIIVVALWSATCATPVATDHFTAAKVAGAPKVVVLNSGVSSVATRVLESFVRNTNYEVSEFLLREDTDEGLLDAIEALQPRAMLALGRRAADFAHENFPESPLVYTLLVEDEEHPIAGPLVAGIGIDVDPGAEFLMYKLVLGNIQNIAAFYTPDRGDALAHRVRDQLAPVGIKLNLIPLPNLEAPEGMSDKIRTADAVWMFNDPGIMSKEGIDLVFAAANEAKKPLLCSAFRELAVAGALMAFSLNFENMGSQAAVLVAELVEHGSLADGPGVRPPLGGYLVFNAATASRLGLTLSDDAQPFVSEVIETNH